MRPRLTKPIRGTVCHRIFNDGLPCYTKRLFTITEREAALSGVRSTGDRYVDDAMLSQIVRVTIPICDMIDIRQNGGNVHIEKAEHRKLAIDLIDAHLTNWSRLAMIVNDPIESMPMDDLRSMNEFMMDLIEIYNRDRLHEDLQEFRTNNEWKKGVHEEFSFLRPQRSLRPIRSSLNSDPAPLTAEDMDLPENTGDFDESLSGRFDEEGIPEMQQTAFQVFRRRDMERPSAFDAIQEIIKKRQL